MFMNENEVAMLGTLDSIYGTWKGTVNVYRDSKTWRTQCSSTEEPISTSTEVVFTGRREDYRGMLGAFDECPEYILVYEGVDEETYVRGIQTALDWGLMDPADGEHLLQMLRPPSVEVINLTPHDVTILEGDEKIVLPRSSAPARVTQETLHVGEVSLGDDELVIPLVKKTFGSLEDLPEREPGKLLLVSALAAQAAWAVGRDDVVCGGDPVRNEQGQIIGITSLCVGP